MEILAAIIVVIVVLPLSVYAWVQKYGFFGKARNDTELLPCPFCGGNPTWQVGDEFVFCENCGVQVDSGISWEETKKMWNTRNA